MLARGASAGEVGLVWTNVRGSPNGCPGGISPPLGNCSEPVFALCWVELGTGLAAVSGQVVANLAVQPVVCPPTEARCRSARRQECLAVAPLQVLLSAPKNEHNVRF